VTITEPTCMNPRTAPSHPSLPDLDAVEAQAAEAISLGRRLAAETDPAWQLYQITFVLTGTPHRPGLSLSLWTESQDAAGVQRWADRLGVEVTNTTTKGDLEDIHHNADGVLDGVPVHVWSIVRTPITNIAICENRDCGWHVGYDQGGVRKIAYFGDEATARAWASPYRQVAAA
jgi:hypothetical protein